jgi:serine/threonine-protein kinase
MGTAHYMAPEQLSAGTVDARTDVFAIAVIVAESLIGLRPFRGRTQPEVLLSILNDRIRLPGTGQDWRNVEAVLQKGSSAEPDRRYSSARELRVNLISALSAIAASPRSPLAGENTTQLDPDQAG